VALADEHGASESSLEVVVKFVSTARHAVQKHVQVHQTQSFAVHHEPGRVDIIVRHLEPQRRLPEPAVNVVT